MWRERLVEQEEEKGGVDALNGARVGGKNMISATGVNTGPFLTLRDTHVVYRNVTTGCS